MLGLPIEIYWSSRRTFNLTYKEYIQAIRSNCSKFGYSNHILNTGHTYDTTTDTMDVIRIGRKSRYLNTLEKYHTYKISRNNLHVKYTYIEAYKLIFQRVHELYYR
jgi:precorrin-6B methylase 2